MLVYWRVGIIYTLEKLRKCWGNHEQLLFIYRKKINTSNQLPSSMDWFKGQSTGNHPIKYGVSLSNCP
jgi:hypothetical protein